MSSSFLPSAYIKLNMICLQAFCHSTFTKSKEICLDDENFLRGGKGWWIGRGSSERCLKWGGGGGVGVIKGSSQKLKTGDG